MTIFKQQIVSKNITQGDVRLQSSVLRGPLGFALDLTNKCNLDCKHCYNRSGRNRFVRPTDELSDDEIVALTNDVAAMKPRVFCFCGGEPLLRKALLLKCISILSHSGVRVNLVTNGLLLNRQVAEDLRNSGLHLIQISLDGATSKSYEKLRNKKGSFAKVVNAIQIASQAGFSVTTSCIPNRFNINEFDQILSLNKSLGVVEVNMQPLMPIGQSLLYTREILLSERETRMIVKQINEFRKVNRLPKVTWGDPIDHFVRFSIFQKEPNLHLEVRANGDISVSFYMSLILGNIRRHSIVDYWDRGINRIWADPVLQQVGEKFRNVTDLSVQQPASFFEKPIDYDVIDDTRGAGHDNILRFIMSSINWRKEHDPYFVDCDVSEQTERR